MVDFKDLKFGNRRDNKIFVEGYGWRSIYYDINNGKNFILIKGEKVYFK